MSVLWKTMSLLKDQFSPDCMDCAHECLADVQCRAFNFNTRSSGKELNCQLTNVLKHDFKRSGKSWMFHQPAPMRQMSTSNACKLVSKNKTKDEKDKEDDKKPNDPFSNTTILSGEPLAFISHLQSWVPGHGTWSVCWHANRDGWDVDAQFHKGCDGKGPTLTVVKVNTYIFGGYTEASWKAPAVPGFQYKMAPESFIFSLRNKDNLAPFNAPLIDKDNEIAIVARIGNGPTFGFFSDLEISNNANANTHSTTNFGRSYQAPKGYGYLRPETVSLLAGSQNFSPSEIEVYYLAVRPF